jgi:hypothetical protein
MRSESPSNRAAPVLKNAQPRLFARDVIAGHRHDALLFGQLQLENHHRLLAERHLRRRKVEFPHARKPHVIEPLDLLPMGEEAGAPCLEGLGIMQA